MSATSEVSDVADVTDVKSLDPNTGAMDGAAPELSLERSTWTLR